MPTSTKNNKSDIAMNNLLKEIMDIEGGEFIEYDGTLSNRGLNQKLFDEYNRRNKKPLKSVKEATAGEYKDVVKQEIVGRHGLKNVPDKFLPVVVDFAFNSGPAQAAKSFQEMVGAKADGIVGPKTMEAFNKVRAEKGDDYIINQMSDKRLKFLSNLSKQRDDIRRDLNGLNNRVERIRQFNLQQIGGNR